jgi:hypothetical protein
MLTNSTTSEKASLPILIKLRDVALLLSVSRQTVHNLIDSGDLKGCGVNAKSKTRKHLRITQESLCKFYKKRFGHSLTDALKNQFEP